MAELKLVPAGASTFRLKPEQDLAKILNPDQGFLIQLSKKKLGQLFKLR